MGVLIIRTHSEADTMVIAEVARRFDCQVDFRFGDCRFSDGNTGGSQVVQVRETFDKGTEKVSEGNRQDNQEVRKFIKKHTR